MQKKIWSDWKIWLGITISIVFMFLAFRKVDFHQMKMAFAKAKYWLLVPALLNIFFSHWLRSVRWRIFLEPVKKIKTGPLFSALLIGYMANTFLPAHIGELFRAYIIGKKEKISPSTVFGTILIERIIDVLSLIALMGFTIIVFPFPDWVKNSGYIFLVCIIMLLAALILMKVYREQSIKLWERLLKPLPKGLAGKIIDLVFAFLDGVVPLKNWKHYVWVTILTVFIWLGYALSFQIVFFAFDMTSNFGMPWYACLVLLVITTISVLVPSSPGYIGTYHWLCQLSLGLFSVPKSTGLSYAFVMHGLNFFPIILVGLIILVFGKMSLRNIRQNIGQVQHK